MTQWNLCLRKLNKCYVGTWLFTWAANFSVQTFAETYYLSHVLLLFLLQTFQHNTSLKALKIPIFCFWIWLANLTFNSATFPVTIYPENLIDKRLKSPKHRPGQFYIFSSFLCHFISLLQPSYPNFNRMWTHSASISIVIKRHNLSIRKANKQKKRSKTIITSCYWSEKSLENCVWEVIACGSRVTQIFTCAFICSVKWSVILLL